MTVLGGIVICIVYSGQDEQWQADHVSLIHLRQSAVSTGLLSNLGTFMLQQPWCDFPNPRPKRFFVYNIKSGIVHENTGFCEAAKQDYVLERTTMRCRPKCNAEPFPLLACSGLVWLHWSLAVIQNHKIHAFCVLLKVWRNEDTTGIPLLLMVF